MVIILVRLFNFEDQTTPLILTLLSSPNRPHLTENFSPESLIYHRRRRAAPESIIGSWNHLSRSKSSKISKIYCKNSKPRWVLTSFFIWVVILWCCCALLLLLLLWCWVGAVVMVWLFAIVMVWLFAVVDGGGGLVRCKRDGRVGCCWWVLDGCCCPLDGICSSHRATATAHHARVSRNGHSLSHQIWCDGLCFCATDAHRTKIQSLCFAHMLCFCMTGRPSHKNLCDGKAVAQKLVQRASVAQKYKALLLCDRCPSHKKIVLVYRTLNFFCLIICPSHK